jgi:hypothetical protein
MTHARINKTKLSVFAVLLTAASVSATVEVRDTLEVNGVLDMKGNEIIDVQGPDNPQDAANKRYVDENRGATKQYVKENFANRSFVTNRTGIPTGNEPYLNWYKSADSQVDSNFCNAGGGRPESAYTSVSCPSDEVLIAKGTKSGSALCEQDLPGWYDSYFDLDSSGSRVFTRGQPNLGGGTSVSYETGGGAAVTAVVMCMET